jgi:hypothetical protein
MAETAEQLMIRMGFDAVQVKLGLAKMQADNEAAAVRVTGIWKKAEADRRMMTVAEVEKTEAAVTAIEIEEATRRNRARFLLRQRGLKQEAALIAEQEAANVAILGGSIPENMAGGTERKAAKEAAADLEAGVAGAAGAGLIKSAGRREAMTLIKESLMGGSASAIVFTAAKLAMHVFDVALYWVAIALAEVGIIDELLPRLWGGTTISGAIGAYRSSKANQASLKQKQGDAAAVLRERVRRMQEAGLISDSRAKNLNAGMDKNAEDGILAAFNVTNPLMGHLHDEENRKAGLAGGRAGLKTGQDKYTWDLLQQYILHDKILTLKKGSVAYDTALKEIQKTSVELAKDKVEMTKDETEEKKKAAKEAEKEARKEKEKSDRIFENQEKLKHNASEQSKALSELQKDEILGMPTLEQAAGKRFTETLAQRYLGMHGRDLRYAARDYERQQFGMGEDFEQWSLSQTDKEHATYGDWLKTTQGKGEEAYLNKIGMPLQALGIVGKNDAVAGKIEDLKVISQNIVNALARDGVFIKDAPTPN